jgi:hypothetical protein
LSSEQEKEPIVDLGPTSSSGDPDSSSSSTSRPALAASHHGGTALMWRRERLHGHAPSRERAGPTVREDSVAPTKRYLWRFRLGPRSPPLHGLRAGTVFPCSYLEHSNAFPGSRCRACIDIFAVPGPFHVRGMVSLKPLQVKCEAFTSSPQEIPNTYAQC